MNPAVHASAQGEGGHHRLGPGQRLARGTPRSRSASSTTCITSKTGPCRSTSRSCGSRCSTDFPSTRLARLGSHAPLPVELRDLSHRQPFSCPKNASSSPAAPGSSAPTLAERCSIAATRSIGMDNLMTGDAGEHRASGERDFHFIKHDVTNYIYVEGPVDSILHFASPASPIDYLELPIQTLKVGSLGTHKALGLAKAKGARSARVDVRGLRRSAGAPAEGDVLGQRQPDRAARRLRRGQALRRSDDDGLPPLPRRGHEDRPHLQHLRPADAAARRPRGAGVHGRRRCAARTSPSSATGRRPAASAT